jgi:flagellar biosynthesis protein FlhB
MQGGDEVAENESGEEKSEIATPRKRREAREKGQVARSMDINSSILLISATICLSFLGPYLMDGFKAMARFYIISINDFNFTLNEVLSLMFFSIYQFSKLIAPLFLVFFTTAILVNIMQVGLVISGESITPKMEKIDPIKGMKRLFSLRALVDLVKSLIKISIVGYIIYSTIYGQAHLIPSMMNVGFQEVLKYTSWLMLLIMIKAAVALLIIASLDYLYQRFQFEKDIRMTKKELRDEMKETEGDPQVKARIRAIQRQLAMQRMMSDIEKADVVITNPIHYAVALEYKPNTMESPVILAKGARLVAERIKEMAREHDIPIVENQPLAQSLFKGAEVGQSIPMELFGAVAEVLAYVYNLKNKSPVSAA